jgi:hypothetical protein
MLVVVVAVFLREQVALGVQVAAVRVQLLALEQTELLTREVVEVGKVAVLGEFLLVLAVQALLSSKSPMPIVRHSLAVLPTLYRLQAQT